MDDSAARILLLVEHRKGCADRDAIVEAGRFGSRGCGVAGGERGVTREAEAAAEDPGQFEHAALAWAQGVERTDAQAQAQAARRGASAAAPQPDAQTRCPGD